MEYKDDLLNVHGLLQSKIKKNLSDTIQVAQSMEQSAGDIKSLSKEIDAMTNEVIALSEQLGIAADPLEQTETVNKPPQGIQSDIKIQLSEDYDFDSAYKDLVSEAQQAGFCAVQPRDVLSEAEMKKAAEYADWLDARFEKETQLTAKDVALLVIAVSVKVLAYYMLPHIGEKQEDEIKLIDIEETFDHTPDNPVHALDNLISTGDAILGQITGTGSRMAFIRNEQEILTQPIPFDIHDNAQFSSSDILGFDPKLGWLFGVLNILTNTVTLKNMESFSVFTTDLGEMQVYDRLSTSLNILYPVVREIRDRKESLIAAVVREADVLKITHTTADNASEILSASMAMEQNNKDHFSQLSSFAPTEKFNLGRAFQTSAIASFVNILISAICAVRYDPKKDGDIKSYVIRTNKIITISNAITAVANNIPALIAEDFSELDLGSIFATLVSLIHSTKFWIDVKTDYLVSEYKKEIDKQFAVINRYFEVVPDNSAADE